MNKNLVPSSINAEINHAIRATTRTATEHYSIKPGGNRIRSTTPTRSKD